MIWLYIGLTLYVLVLLTVAWVSLHPVRTPVFISPGAIGAPQEEVAFCSVDGLNLRGWWVEGDPEGGCVAVLCHGYLMCRSELTPLAATLWRHGCSCLLFDFRAHGKSSGRATGLGLREIEDVRAAVAFAKARRPGAQIVLIGSSMGAVASGLAWRREPGLADAVILDSAYSRLYDAVSGWWRFVGGPVLSIVLWPCVWISAPLAGFNPRKVDLAKELRGADGSKVLLLHGTADIIALPKDAERNAAACAPPGRLVWFEGCGHSEGRWIEPRRYEEEVLGFLASAVGLGARKP